MKIDQIFNDPVLCILSFLLLLIWAGAKFRFYSLPRVDAETLAVTLLRLACGLLLWGASLDKIGDAAGFLGLIKQCYFYVPAALQPLTVIVIPWLEFFTGLCLILGFRWRGAALIFSSLMAVYSLAIFWDVLNGIDCACGCFSKDAVEKMTWMTVVRDLLFFAMGSVLLKSPKMYKTLDGFKAA